MLKFKKKGLCESQICFIEEQNAGRGDRIAEARKRSERRKDGLRGLEIILQIRRLRRSFCGAPSPS